MTARGPAISRFTPSLMAHSLLERLFVARESVLDGVVLRIDAAGTSNERNHTLLVGPRGAGKTHLIALAYHRAQAMRAAETGVQVSWLPEDPWTIASYRHLLVAIAENLEPEVGEEVPRTAEALESLLTQRAQDNGPIVVFLENLDVILTNLGDDGQQHLRHFLQADYALLLVATTTRLDRSLTDQAHPFYGFFTTARLEPFTVGQAAEMLQRVADESGDEDLRNYIASSQGRSRLTTIAHLAGGQPRMWATLSSALTIDSLDELVELLLTRFDDLTPYYQEQLGRLSPQQRLAVAELAAADRPVAVGELADLVEVSQQSMAKTMSDLVERGWAAPTTSPVVAHLDRRKSYYELSEPLARLSFQIKESRGKPIRLVVDFLKMWFDPADLSAKASTGAGGQYLEQLLASQDSDAMIGVTRRLQRLPVTRAPAVGMLGDLDDALSQLSGGTPSAFLQLPSTLRSAVEANLPPGMGGATEINDVRREVHDHAAAEFGYTRHEAMLSWIGRAEDLVNSAPRDRRSLARLTLASWLGRAWRFPEAEAVLVEAELKLGRTHSDTLFTRSALAGSYRSAGRTSEAITLDEVVLTDRERIFGPDHLDTLTSRNNLATSYWHAGRTTDAITLYQTLVSDRERILGRDHPDTLTGRGNLASSYWSAGRTAEAVTLLETVLNDRERILGPDHPDTLANRGNLAISYWSAGRTAEAVTLLESVLSESERILGPDHPNTVGSRHNLASSYQSAGRITEAIALQETVLIDRERILGPDHPDTLASRNNLAVAYSSAGRTTEAIALEEAVFTDCERVLGPDHPTTQATAATLLAWRNA